MRILLATVILLIIGLLDILSPVRGLFQKFTAPVQFGLRRSAIEIKDTSRLVYKINSIRKENLALLKENRELKGQVLDLKKAEAENQLLKTQLGLKDINFKDKELVIASVMGNPTDLTGTSFIIDKGLRQGVKEGNNVIVGNFLIGIVDEVTPDKSKVTTVMSPKLSVTVVNIDSGSNAEGIAHGDAGTSIMVSRLLPGEKVEVGNMFITSGKDGKFLPGLGVGQVVSVSFESADPLKNATLDPVLDLNSLEKVFVILN